jgi:hypothetical protein
MESSELYAVLPYLKSSGIVSVRGIRFYPSSRISEYGDLSESAKRNLSALTSMFFMSNEVSVEAMLVAALDSESGTLQDVENFRRLREARTLVSYLYTSPQGPTVDPFLTHEHADMFVFRPAKISRFLPGVDDADAYGRAKHPGSGKLDGYRGLKNFHTHLWAVEGSRIYPSLPAFWLNISQDLYRDLAMISSRAYYSPIVKLMQTEVPFDGALENRVFRAMHWYNLSASRYFGEDVAIIALAVGFESLFDLEQGPDVTRRFLESVRLLVGRIPRLDSWIDQFYTARSKILHTGYWPHLGFYATGEEVFKAILKGKHEERFYRTLSSYGRRIFRLCLDGILTSVVAAAESGLRSLFEHNQDRLNSICEKLSDVGVGAEKRMASVAQEVLDLHEYWFESEDLTENRSVIGAGRLMARALLDLESDAPDPVKQALQAIVDISDESEYDQLRLFVSLDTALEEWRGPAPSPQSELDLDVWQVMQLYADFASMPGFLLRTEWPDETNGDSEEHAG